MALRNRPNRPLGFRRMSRDLLGRRPIGGAPPVEPMLFHGWGGKRGSILFMRGTSGLVSARIPCSPIRTQAGTLLIAYEIRSNIALDNSVTSFALMRSTDDGETWSAPVSILTTASVSATTINNPCLGVAPNGDIICVYAHNGVSATSKLQKIVSTAASDGVAWSAGADLAAGTKGVGWQFYLPGPCPIVTKQLAPHANRMVLPCYHRYSTDTGQPAYANLIYSDNNGVDWSLGDSIAETATNQYAIEPTAVELPDGNLYVTNRMRTGIYKAHYLADGQDILGDVVIDDDPNNTIVSLDCQGSLCKLTDTDYIASVPFYTGTGGRAIMRVYLSEDACVTFPYYKDIFYKWAAYSGLLRKDDNTVFIFYERGYQGAADTATTWADHLAVAKLNKQFIKSANPNSVQFAFNEMEIGRLAVAGGPSILDYTENVNVDERLVPQTTAVPPVSVAGSVGEALQLSGSGADYIAVSEQLVGFCKFAANEAFTIEMVVNVPSIPSVLFATGPLTGSTPTMFIRNYAAGATPKVDFTLNTGGGDKTITSLGATILTSGLHKIVARRATNGSMDLYIDDVLQGTNAGSAGSLINATYAANIGQTPDNLNDSPLTIDFLKITKGLVDPANFHVVGEAKPERPQIDTSYTNFPGLIPGCQYYVPGWLPNAWFSGKYLGSQLPALVPGLSFNSGYECSPNRFPLQSVNDTVFRTIDSDATLGPVLKMTSASSGNPSANLVALGTTGSKFAFIPSTGQFTIMGWFMILDATGGYQMLLDNCNATGANPGFNVGLIENSSNDFQMWLAVSGNGGRRFDGIWGAHFARNIWKHFVFQGNGIGNACYLRLSSATDSSVVAELSSGTLTSSGAGAVNPTLNLKLGGKANDALQGLRSKILDICIFDRGRGGASPITTTEMNAHFNYGKANLTRFA